MDAGEGIIVVFVSIIAGFLSVFLLKEILSDFIFTQLIDSFEYILDQLYYQTAPLTDPEWAASMENSYNFGNMALDSLRFLVGFLPTLCFGIRLVNR
ncbi:hypothetical protein [Methanocorpusculum labreanum]|uniref:hypothetical protein n=1 Tax=Methanocorpusculum labreanum TaxID=83984 RepID=UPI00064E5C95|nr:hypothetical protein [Methanocorpusculum labreanum]